MVVRLLCHCQGSYADFGTEPRVASAGEVNMRDQQLPVVRQLHCWLATLHADSVLDVVEYMGTSASD